MRHLATHPSLGLVAGALCAFWLAPALDADRSGADAQAQAGAARCARDRSVRSALAARCVQMVPTAAANGASGVMRLTLARSPFGVTVTEDGRYIYDIRLELSGLAPRRERVYVAWAATPNLERRKKLGVIGADLTLSGQADWNRFLVVVTAERSPDVESWAGPILLSAISPSGWMQTMAGEEIFGNNELPVKSRYCLVNRC